MALSALFLYGTLRHLPLLEAVLGRSADDLDMAEAVLPDHAVFEVRDQPFPMIAPATGQSAPGLILRTGDEDAARIDYYEGGFDYDLRAVEARTQTGAAVAAEVYFPQEGRWLRDDLWALDHWEREWAALSVRTAQEAMSYFGRWSAADLAHRLPFIRRRAAAFLNAQARGRAPEHRDGADHVRMLDSARVHSNFFAIDHVRLTHPRYDGTTTDPLDREMFYVGDAATVLIYDPVRDCVLLTEQFRPNVWANGDPSPWVQEPVSGLVDPGETPEAAARREALEETGVTLGDLHLVGQCYSSTGSSTEFVSMYLGLGDLSQQGASGGVADEGEDIRTVHVPFPQFAEAIRSHRYRDMPLLATGQWLMMNRDGLRSSA